jgi:hypothetical protein
MMKLGGFVERSKMRPGFASDVAARLHGMYWPADPVPQGAERVLEDARSVATNVVEDKADDVNDVLLKVQRASAMWKDGEAAAGQLVRQDVGEALAGGGRAYVAGLWDLFVQLGTNARRGDALIRSEDLLQLPLSIDRAARDVLAGATARSAEVDRAKAAHARALAERPTLFVEQLFDGGAKRPPRDLWDATVALVKIVAEASGEDVTMGLALAYARDGTDRTSEWRASLLGALQERVMNALVWKETPSELAALRHEKRLPVALETIRTAVVAEVADALAVKALVLELADIVGYMIPPLTPRDVVSAALSSAAGAAPVLREALSLVGLAGRLVRDTKGSSMMDMFRVLLRRRSAWSLAALAARLADYDPDRTDRLLASPGARVPSSVVRKDMEYVSVKARL